jgi:hypothetical protein
MCLEALGDSSSEKFIGLGLLVESMITSLSLHNTSDWQRLESVENPINFVVEFFELTSRFWHTDQII